MKKNLLERPNSQGQHFCKKDEPFLKPYLSSLEKIFRELLKVCLCIKLNKEYNLSSQTPHFFLVFLRVVLAETNLAWTDFAEFVT